MLKKTFIIAIFFILIPSVVLLLIPSANARCFGIPEFKEGSIVEKTDLGPAMKKMNSKLPEPVMLTSCVYSKINDRIYCFGGWNGNSGKDWILEYNTFLWGKLKVLEEKFPEPIYLTTCVYADKFDKIYCLGGSSKIDYISDIYEFDPVTKKLTKKNNMEVGRQGPACMYSLNDDKIYCGGGAWTYDGIVYDPELNTVEPFFNHKISGDTVSCPFSKVDNTIYCFGVWDHFQDIYRFDETSKQLILQKTFLPDGRGLLSCNYVDDENIYCIGGLGYLPFGKITGITDEILKFNPITKKLSEENATLPTPLYGLSCVYSDKKKKIYCFGGFNGKSAVDNIVEYNPKKDFTNFEINQEEIVVASVFDDFTQPPPIKDRPDPIPPPAFSEEESKEEKITSNQIIKTVIAALVYIIFMLSILILRTYKKNKT